MRSILSRLEELENRCKPRPLIVIAENEQGEQLECTARECIEKGYGFVRCVGGNDFRDLDMLLAVMKATAENE